MVQRFGDGQSASPQRTSGAAVLLRADEWFQLVRIDQYMSHILTQTRAMLGCVGQDGLLDRAVLEALVSAKLDCRVNWGMNSERTGFVSQRTKRAHLRARRC